MTGWMISIYHTGDTDSRTAASTVSFVISPSIASLVFLIMFIIKN